MKLVGKMVTRRGDAQRRARPSLPLRLARLHPAWMVALVVVSLLPLAIEVLVHSQVLQIDSAALRLVNAALSALTIFLPLIYIFFIAVIVSGRFHSRERRRLLGPALLAAMPLVAAIGFTVFAIASEGSNKSDALAFGLPMAGMTLAALFSYYYRLVSISKELLRAENGNHYDTVRRVVTFIALFFWPVGFFWIQARVRRLVKEFESGEFSRLPVERLGYFDEIEESGILTLTERIGERQAERYAVELARRLGAKTNQSKRTPNGRSWKFTTEGAQLSLLFDAEAPLFSLKSETDSGNEILFSLRSRLSEGI